MTDKHKKPTPPVENTGVEPKFEVPVEEKHAEGGTYSIITILPLGRDFWVKEFPAGTTWEQVRTYLKSSTIRPPFKIIFGKNIPYRG